MHTALPLTSRPDYERFLAQETAYFPRATREAVARLLTSSLPAEAEWIAREREGFPDDLSLIGDAPDVLVYEGDIRLLSRQVRLVVAGSREAPQARCEETERLCTALSRHGITVMSGLVSAIDIAAHRGSLAAVREDAAAASSCAIVAAPLGAPWPYGRHEFARELCDAGGLIVSLTPQVRGLSMSEAERVEVHNYRQRVTAALATAVLIMHVETGGFTQKLIEEAVALERPVIIWDRAFEPGRVPAVEALLENPPVDATGRPLVMRAGDAGTIEEAISAWQLVWWL